VWRRCAAVTSGHPCPHVQRQPASPPTERHAATRGRPGRANICIQDDERVGVRFTLLQVRIPTPKPDSHWICYCTPSGECPILKCHPTRQRVPSQLSRRVICSQNWFWYPKLLPPVRSARMGVGKRILHPQRPKTASYGLTRRQKTPKHPKTLLNHSGRNEL
jgi:hypothetical protein